MNDPALAAIGQSYAATPSEADCDSSVLAIVMRTAQHSAEPNQSEKPADWRADGLTRDGECK
jgi:hypothetical protein